METLITLQNTLSDLETKLGVAQTNLNNLNSDSGYIAMYNIWNDPRVQKGNYGWIDSGGIYWEGADAKAEHLSAHDEIIKHQAAVTAAIQSVTTLTAQVAAAQSAVTNYETASPIVAAQAKADIAAADANAAAVAASTLRKNIALGVGGLVLFLIFVGGIIYYYRKNKNQK